MPPISGQWKDRFATADDGSKRKRVTLGGQGRTRAFSGYAIHAKFAA
jgi:hypothetical protein